MEPRLQVLELYLNRLGESTDIGSLDDRLRIQKAVYLAQLFGADLGYRYSWYVHGPYCPSLTQDYYELGNEQRTQGFVLNEAFTSSLDKAKELLKKPNDIPLPASKWYELLASYHYLIKISRRSHQEAEEIIRRLKPHLVEYIASGKNHLEANSLI